MANSALAPLYTRENCRFFAPLRWGVSVFWREPMADAPWLDELAAALVANGLRLRGHRFASSTVSQFVVRSMPEVDPQTIVQRLKGRLQYLVRRQRPKALQGNYAIRSFGRVTRRKIERYVVRQLAHHPLADARFAAQLAALQFHDDSIDLAEPQTTSHGRYWHNLHLVLVHRERWREWREESLLATRAMIVAASAAKGYRLSRVGLLPDHVHVVLGCPLAVSPGDVALGFLNNLAYVQGMKAVFQYGAFVGTVGEYDTQVVQSDMRTNAPSPNAPAGLASVERCLDR